MYTTDIICSNGHKFEGWFGSRSAFESQCGQGLVSCPECGDISVKQLLTPVRIKKHADGNAAGSPSEKRMSVVDYIEKNFEDVGAKFADEAIKIHTGEVKKRNIRGTATEEEEKKLSDEGVPFVKIPNIQ